MSCQDRRSELNAVNEWRRRIDQLNNGSRIDYVHEFGKQFTRGSNVGDHLLHLASVVEAILYLELLDERLLWSQIQRQSIDQTRSQVSTVELFEGFLVSDVRQ